MRRFGTDRPTPLPVQALDHATGYILAAAALRGLAERLRTGAGLRARASLARTAALLTSLPAEEPGPDLGPPDDAAFDPAPEATAWGPALRLRPPVEIKGLAIRWDRPAGPLRRDEPRWTSAPGG